MSDLFDQVTGDQDIFKKLASKIPGFDGYIERQNRRAADKLMREINSRSFRSSLQTHIYPTNRLHQPRRNSLC